MAKTISFFNLKTKRKESVPIGKTKLVKTKRGGHARTAKGKDGTKMFRFVKKG